MRTLAVIPLRGLADGKSRLSSLLPDRARRALIAALLERVARAVQASGNITTIVVVSPDPAVLRLAESLRLIGLAQTNTGLNAALWQATNWARDQHFDALLALHADLPLITAQSVRELMAGLTPLPPSPPKVGEGEFAPPEAAGIPLSSFAGEGLGVGPTVLVVRDRYAHGTNALLMQPVGATTFHFGEQSFARHLAASEARGLRTVPYYAPALAFDLDTPADLAALAVGHPVAFVGLCWAVRRWLPRVASAQSGAAIAHPIGEVRP